MSEEESLQILEAEARELGKEIIEKNLRLMKLNDVIKRNRERLARESFRASFWFDVETNKESDELRAAPTSLSFYEEQSPRP
jgi:hypothetical protein